MNVEKTPQTEQPADLSDISFNSMEKVQGGAAVDYRATAGAAVDYFRPGTAKGLIGLLLPAVRP